MTQRPGLNFSFSGLKTQVLTTWREAVQNEQTRADIAYAVETAIVETLAIKCHRALRQTGLQRLVVTGGVGANQRLRARLTELTKKWGATIYYPRTAFCTDNGAMIAYCGWLRFTQQKFQAEPLGFKALPRWTL
jgi:N6-L-threonylcarbamoyladenine synthase